MKAIVYEGPRDVQWLDVPDPQIEHPAAVIVKITGINNCGSDLHLYRRENPRVSVNERG